MTDLARACIEYRVKHSLTQEELAKMCGITRQTLASVEDGKSVLKTTEVKIRMKLEASNEG